MLHKRTFVIAGAILAWGASLEAAISVGYFNDSSNLTETLDMGLADPIARNGFTPVQITDIAAFVGAGNLSTIKILLIDEVSTGEVHDPSPALLSQAAALSAWVAGGGVIAIHDRNLCRAELGTLCTPVPGATFRPTVSFGTDINVDTTSVTLVTNGPFGVITNATLDGGNFSDLGFVATLPAGAVGILNNGTPGNEVALSYRFGSGWVYYSTIPLDFFVNLNNIANFNPQPVAFRTIYAPNMVAYLACLAGVTSCSTTGPNPTPAATAAPTLSQWGLGILAIMLMGCAAVMLRSGQAKGPAR
jgi:hypothetical protein